MQPAKKLVQDKSPNSCDAHLSSKMVCSHDVNNKNWCAYLSSEHVIGPVHWCSCPCKKSIKWASDPLCKTMLGAQRSPCTTPCSWMRQSSSNSWRLSGYSWIELLDRKLQGRNSAPLICIEVWDIFYCATHVCHYQCFKMIWAEETIDFRYASSLQIWQNIVDTSFPLQHLFSILPRCSFDDVFFIACCPNEYLSCPSVFDTLSKQYFDLIGWCVRIVT